MNIHPLSRKHLNQDSQLSGMPGHPENSSLSQLHLNLNYFSDSNYIQYPPDQDKNICMQFINFLEKESLWKRCAPPSFLKPNNLLFFSTSHAIDLIVRTFCEPIKDSICIANPTFPLYAFCAYTNNSPIINIPLEGRSLDQINVQKIVDSGAKIIFLPAPNNPVGNMPQRLLIIELLKRFNGLIVIDEAYIEFSDQGSFIEYLPDHPNLIILRSFSKIWGHAGIRSGVVIGSEMIINTLKKVLPPCFFPSHTQEILRAILEHPEKILEMGKIAQTEREKLTNGLKALPEVHYVYPSQSNFLLVEFVNGPAIYAKLLDHGILVKNLHTLIPNALRISLGTIEENARLLQILQ